MRKYALSMLALLGCATPALADGGPSAEFRKVGAWDVRIDSTLGNGCFIFASYPSGDILRVGIDNSQAAPSAYMFVGNTAWKSLVNGLSYTLSFAFDGGLMFDWQGAAMTLGTDSKLLDFKFDNAQFLNALASHETMRVFYQGKLLTALNLPGAQAALQTLTECQHQFGVGRVATKSDPFR